MKELAVACFVGAIVFSGAPPLALVLTVIGLVLVVAWKWP